jgi:hypothetical protein
MPGSDRRFFDHHTRPGSRVFFDAPESPAVRPLAGTRDIFRVLTRKMGRIKADRRGQPRYEPELANVTLAWEPVPGVQATDEGYVANISQGGAEIRSNGLLPPSGQVVLLRLAALHGQPNALATVLESSPEGVMRVVFEQGCPEEFFRQALASDGG